MRDNDKKCLLNSMAFKDLKKTGKGEFFTGNIVGMSLNRYERRLAEREEKAWRKRRKPC